MGDSVLPNSPFQDTMISTSQLELYRYPHNKLSLALVARSSDFRERQVGSMFQPPI